MRGLHGWWWILVVLVIGGCGRETEHLYPTGPRLPMPAYPSAQFVVVDAHGYEPYNWPRTKTTFVTEDAPGVVQEWYAETFQAAGWHVADFSQSRISSEYRDQPDLALSTNPTVRQTMLGFRDPEAECPEITAEVYTARTSVGTTMVEVYAMVGECFK